MLHIGYIHIREGPPIICTTMYQQHGLLLPFVSYSAKAFAWGVCPARCSDSCADFAKRRNGFKRRLEAYKRKVYGQGHTGSQQKFDQSAKFGRAGSPAAVYPCAGPSAALPSACLLLAPRSGLLCGLD